MKMKYLGAMIVGVLVIAGCSEDEKDKSIQYLTGINPDWFRSAPAPVTLDNAQELQTNILSPETNELSDIKPSSSYEKTKTPFALNTLAFVDKLQEVNSLLSVSDFAEELNLSLPCTVSGNKDVYLRKDAQSEYFSSVNIFFNSCKENYTVINGKVEILNSEENVEGSSTEINFLTDLSFQTKESTKVMKKDSQIKIENLEDYANSFKLTQTYIMDYNNKTFGAEDLVSVFQRTDKKLTYYLVSGREYILNGSSYFDVDPTYDASLRPFVINDGILQEGGLFKYLGKDGNKVELEISNINEVTIRADKDGDGIFDFNAETKVYKP